MVLGDAALTRPLPVHWADWAFVFSTLTRITLSFRAQPLEAIERCRSGGGLVGDQDRRSLLAFSPVGRRVTAGGPVAIIVSDRWDRASPFLAEEIARLRRSVHPGGLAPDPAGLPRARGCGRTPHTTTLPAGRLIDLAGRRLLKSIPERRLR